jgi:hypothetical protein
MIVWHRARCRTNFDHNTIMWSVTTKRQRWRGRRLLAANYQMFDDLSEALGSVTAPAPAFLMGVERQVC